MTGEEKLTQLRVGIFVAIGLLAIGLMVVYFGRFGDAVRSYYQVQVEYPNASGIYRGAAVLLAGAKVGMVETAPVILPDMNGVSVGLKIYEDVEIPSKAEFSIGSSGLLGDKFIQIDLPKGAKDSPAITPGTVIKGKGSSGMEDMMEKSGEIIASVKLVMDDVQVAVKNINGIAEKLNTNVFKESSISDLNATMANLRQTSESFASASKKIDGVMEQASSAIKTGEQTMNSTKDAADELKKAISEIRTLIQRTKNGQGALGVLLADKETADNIRALVANLRKNGILWYKDREGRQPQPSR